MRVIRLGVALYIIAASGPALIPAWGAEIVTGRASVIDGDTIEIRGRRIRLFGIDAPEASQTCTTQAGEPYRCGQKAALVLDGRIGDGVVTCERKDLDRFGRLVASCRVLGEDLSAWMVGLGWALAL